MAIRIDGLQNPQARYLAGDIATERKLITTRMITGQRASPAEDPAKDSLSSQMDVNMNRLRVAKESIEAGLEILGMAAKGAKIALSMADKMEETRAKANSGEISDKERVLLDQHFQSFKSQFLRTVSNTKYGDKNLIDGSLAGGNTVETNTVGIMPDAHAESTLGYKMPSLDLSMLTVGGVRMRLDKANAAAPQSFFMQQTEEAHLSLKDLSAGAVTATAASALKIGGVDFKFKLGAPASPAASIYEIDMTGKTSAADVAMALANAINNTAGQEATTVTALTGFQASAKDGVLSIKHTTKSLKEKIAGADPKFNIEFGSKSNTDLTNHVIASVTQGEDPMQIAADSNTFTVRQIADGEEYFVVGGDVTLTDGTGRKKAADDIAALIQGANGSTVIQNQNTRDLLAALSGTVDHIPETTPGTSNDSVTTLKLSAKRSGISGAFSVVEYTPEQAAGTGTTPTPAKTETFSSQYSADAKVGSLGLSNTSAFGSIDGQAIIKGLGTSVATSGFVDISKDLMTDGTTISISGRTYTLKEVITNPAAEIQVKAFDPLQTLNNIATFFNNQQDPSVANFNFEVNNDRTQNVNQLRFFARTPDDSLNSTQIKISKVGVINSATLTLSGGDAGGINTSRITDNANFTGRVQGFKAILVTTNEVKLQVSVGDFTYEGVIKDTNLPKDTKVIMQSSNVNGGQFTIDLKAGKGMIVDSKEASEIFAKKFDEAFSQVKFYQLREIDSFKPAEDSLLDRTIAEFSAASYKNGVNIERVEVTGSEKTGKASITISLNDGRQYTSTDFGNSIVESQKIELLKITDPTEPTVDSNEKIILRFGRSINLTDPHVTKKFESDLTKAFQADKSPLQFQAGTDINDKINVSIVGFNYEKEFSDKDFNIKTNANAERLGQVMEEVLARAITVDAEIGAGMKAFEQVSKSIQAQILGLGPIAAILGKVDMLEQLAKFGENSTQMDVAVSAMSETDRYSRNLMRQLFQFQ